MQFFAVRVQENLHGCFVYVCGFLKLRKDGMRVSVPYMAPNKDLVYEFFELLDIPQVFPEVGVEREHSSVLM